MKHFIFLFTFLLLFASVCSWAACYSGVTAGYNVGSYWCGTGTNLRPCCSYNDFDCSPTYYQLINGAYHRYYIFSHKSNYCPNPEPWQGTNTQTCIYSGYCDTQEEADSAYCALNPSADGCVPTCDSTKWECHTSVEHSQTTIASDKVECFGGDCYGGVYCEYISKTTTECQSDCGEFTTQSTEVPIRYEGHCNEDNLTDDTECTGVRCMSFEKTGSYSLYKLCASREIVNGERKFFPRFVGGGKGNCKNAGYPESNGNDFSSGSSSVDSVGVPESCFTMGINCPPSDSSSYQSPEDRTPDKCNCQPYDGLSYISQIVCPDGSKSVFYGSCNEWSMPSSSSTTPPESSSSGSENPPASSGGTMSGDWVNYSQGEEIKGILGVIALNTAKEQNINNVNSVNIALDDYTVDFSDSAAPLVVPDSMYNPSYFIDSLGLADSIFKRVTEQNTILDTLIPPVASCPCFTFFSGNGSQSSFLNNRLHIQEIKIDFADFHGFNLCTIISVIVVSLASVVAFFIGFAIFKNVSQ